MPLLTTAEDMDLEAEILAEMTDQCVVNQVTETSNSNGIVITKTPRGPAVACAYGVLSGRELEWAQRVHAEAEVAVTVSKGTVVDESDVLTITDAVTGDVFDVGVVYVGSATRASWLGLYAKNLKA